MWLLVAPRAAKVLMVMRASGSSRPILASRPPGPSGMSEVVNPRALT